MTIAAKRIQTLTRPEKNKQQEIDYYVYTHIRILYITYNIQYTYFVLL